MSTSKGTRSTSIKHHSLRGGAPILPSSASPACPDTERSVRWKLLSRTFRTGASPCRFAPSLKVKLRRRQTCCEQPLLQDMAQTPLAIAERLSWSSPIRWTRTHLKTFITQRLQHTNVHSSPLGRLTCCSSGRGPQADDQARPSLAGPPSGDRGDARCRRRASSFAAEEQARVGWLAARHFNA